jgi:hypothetical protein
VKPVAGREVRARICHRIVGKREGLTMPTTQRRTVMIFLTGLALLAVSGCSNNGETSTPTQASTTGASAANQTYSSKAFVVPLTVTVDAALKSPPNPDSPHLLSWDAAASRSGSWRR